MKKQLLLFCLFFALFSILKMQTILAQKGNALSLPGGSVTTSKMAIPPLNSLITAYPFTVEMWVKPNAITTAGGFWVDRSGSDVSLQFTNDATGGLRNDIFGTSTNATVLANVKPILNVWHHLSLIVRSDSAIVECDGVFYAALNTKAFLTTFCSKYSHVGVDSSANNSTRTVNGLFDEVRIWNTARTRAEIQANKNVILAGTETGLVAYYNFDNNNANDKTSNALNGLITGGTILDLNTVSTLSNINLSQGTVSPTFDPSTTTYTVRGAAGASVTASGIATIPGIAVVSAPVTISATTPSANIVCTAGNSVNTSTYTVNYAQLAFDDWDANGATGVTSYPNMWGWSCSNSSAAWTAAGSGACRYNDVTTGWYFNNTSTAWTGRALYLRWDGSGGTTTSSVFTYQVYLESCKTYSYTMKYSWANNATSPLLTYGFGKDAAGASTIVSDTAQCSVAKQVFKSKSLLFTPPATGVYYISIKAPVAALIAVADLSLTEYAGQSLSANPKPLSLSMINKSAEFIVTGSGLSSNVTLSAPAGITLSKTTIPFGETTCGSKVTATFDFTQNITSGKIYLASNTLKDSVSFTYTKPSVSIYERNIEVENNGRPYPLNVKLGGSVDSIFISPSTGFSVVKDKFSATDFTNGSGSINVQVNSSATIGTTGKLIFNYKLSGVLIKLDSVNVTKVSAYSRYYIKHNSSGYVLGDDATGLYPALTVAKGSRKQKYYMRRVNIDPTAIIDTFNIVQDDAYRVIRKSTTINPTWDTEFGVPSLDAKWTRQDKGAGIYSIANTLSTKVLGSNDNTLGGRVFYDKTYVAGSLQDWLFIDASPEDSTLSSLTVNKGTLTPAFCRDTITYKVLLPAGTASVSSTAVTSIAGATTVGTGLVTVSAGTGVSTIVVTAADGKSKMTYTIKYTVAKSTVAILSNLTVSGTAVAGFATGTLTYNVELPVGTTTVPVVAGTATDSKATVVVTPATALPGATKVDVTAEDGTTKLTYSINFTVAKSTVASLSDLKVGNTTVTAFATGTMTYNVKLSTGTTIVPTVTGTATDSKASVVVTPAAALPGATTVVVTAEDGTTKLTYTINFTVSGVGITTLNGIAFNVYPTISNGSFTVETSGKPVTITVLDINGKVVSKQIAASATETVNIAKAGMYFIKLEYNGTTNLVKVVKTN